ncbi:FAD-dependent oxidoreductase [Terriglobus saanensis]|uniref:Cyclic nucleotide-binding protein n=1 Tax=Terriglobus saanensis (strain ATCC BAA-1853 / DSM 23119 / SP1PR4) TaxID=401053 RepID=E8V0I7_TERSS|nr:cyclic nucleotide-binding domain-containing thioredoxin-disulfide reductase [Terriglobus saanensis]ADV84470.1 cyclic nucleotide-binding protein [Terriglobus saanensis SP1PR4]
MADQVMIESSAWTPDFRADLAFQKLTEDMVDRMRAYGREESFPANVVLFTYGERKVDLFVVLEGEVHACLPAGNGEAKVFARQQSLAFLGELNLLTSQGSLVEARTFAESRLLRISRDELQRLMRSEGDIANLIASATVWRRIGIIGEESAGVALLGNNRDPKMTELQRFLIRNNYPHRVVELPISEAPPEQDLFEGSARTSNGRFPAVTVYDGRTLYHPTIAELADELGITELPDPEMVYDVVVVGAGPSGLAAAVYAASEGLCTIVIEGIAPGGQAGTSSKIENYLGFPTGISGQRLASRAQLQALKFGVRFAISRQVVTAEQVDGIHKLTLAGGIPVCSRAVVVASGAQYRKLSVQNYEEYENRGIYYAATSMEGVLCRDKEVIVVGGGNSAGQAAVFLSGIAKHVHYVVRGKSLATTMSQYLISRIESSAHITLYTGSEIVGLEGDAGLEWVTWAQRRTGETTRKRVGSVFVMIGAEPNSGWLYGTVKLDKKGFVITGGAEGFNGTPYATSVPGMFAVGDVRSASVKRVASAVGEGSVVISDVHRYLADHRNSFAAEPNSTLEALRLASAAAE